MSTIHPSGSLGVTLVLFAVVACSACGTAASTTNTHTESPRQASEAPPETTTERTLTLSVRPDARPAVAPEILGDFDPESFERLLLTRRRALEACYERAVASEPSLQTSIQVECVVRETGMVTDIVAVGDPPNAELTGCVQQIVTGFRFDPGPAGGPATVGAQLVFEQR